MKARISLLIAEQLADLEMQNATLKRLLAEAELEKAALKALANGTLWARARDRRRTVTDVLVRHTPEAL